MLRTRTFPGRNIPACEEDAERCDGFRDEERPLVFAVSVRRGKGQAAEETFLHPVAQALAGKAFRQAAERDNAKPGQRQFIHRFRESAPLHTAQRCSRPVLSAFSLYPQPLPARHKPRCGCDAQERAVEQESPFARHQYVQESDLFILGKAKETVQQPGAGKAGKQEDRVCARPSRQHA